MSEVAILLSSLALSVSVIHGLFGCYKLSKPIKDMINNCLYKMKWHSWRGSYRFVLLQKLLNNELYSLEERKQNIETLKEVIETTYFNQCNPNHLIILCDLLDDMNETELFSVAMIAKLVLTINSENDQVVYWQVIGEMLKKLKSNAPKQKSVLKQLFSQFKTIVENNHQELNTLSIVMELFYEAYCICPFDLEPISQEAENNLIKTHYGELLYSMKQNRLSN